MARALINVPAKAKRGEIIELKALHCLVKQTSWPKAALELGLSRAELEAGVTHHVALSIVGIVVVAGTVVEVRVFNRHGVEKDERAMAIEREEIQRLAKDRDD